MSYVNTILRFVICDLDVFSDIISIYNILPKWQLFPQWFYDNVFPTIHWPVSVAIRYVFILSEILNYWLLNSKKIN